MVLARFTGSWWPVGLGASSEALRASWEGLGASWEGLGASWEDLGGDDEEKEKTAQGQ